MNESIKKLHDLLLAQHATLADKLGETTDPEIAKAIILEMQEVLHRIDVAQNLLFRASSKALENSVAKVTRADSKLAKAIDSAKTAASFINAVSDFLGFVDEAIDLAKALAVA
jgi:hypothetical protein